MRRLLVAFTLAALALALPFGPLRPALVSAGTIAKVQAGPEVTSTTGNLTLTLSSGSTAGDLLVAMVSNGNGAASTPFSGPAGWVNATGLWQTSNGRTEIWYYANNPGGITSAAFTSSSNSIGAAGNMSEFSGVAASSALDKTGTATVSSATTATVSTSASTTTSGDLGITAWGTTVSETSFTAGSGWTHLFSDGSGGAGTDYQLGLAQATASETETAPSSNAGWVFMIATFKPVQVPGAVGSLTATAGSNQATISWTAPATGGAPTYYVVTALSGGTAARNTTATSSNSVTMTGLTAGGAYKFSVYGVNAAGNGTSTTTASSITPNGSADPYTSGVFADAPTFYYRLDETAGSTTLDSSGNGANGTEVASPTQGSASTLSSDTDAATAFNGSSQYAYSNTSYVNPTTFSIEAWFKTTTTTGGKIVGFGTSQTGASGSFDRQVYMNNTGQLYFGVYPGAVKTINSASAYNDGNLHQVVATLSAAGMFLYVDGAQVASDTTTTSAQSYTGYWRIGYDSLANWTSAPTSYFFNGTIDEVAIYPAALSLARVQVHHCEGSNNGCSVPGAASALTATAGANQATVSWTAPSSGGPVSRYVVTALSGGTASRNTTATPTTSVTLTGLAGGTAYKFSVYAANAGGNGSTVTTASTVTPTGTANTYTAAVLTDTPTFYYRLDETAGTLALDSSGNGATSTQVSNPTQGASGTLTTDGDGATQFDGATDYAYSNTSYVNPSTFTIEAWFKTTTTTGGKIVGLGSSQTGNSGSFDRQIYMSNTGQLYFGVYPGAVKTINSTLAYNDGNAHHVVATLSSAGMFLYVDGAQVASDATTTTAQSYTGYWRIGYDNLSGWTAAPTSNFFKGTIDEVAVYPTALSLQRAQVHYCGGSNNSCLSMAGPTTVTFPSQTLDGLDHTKTVTATFDVTDNNGSGNGWNITATSTTFVAGSHSLSTTATTVQAAPSDACDAGWTCTFVTNSTSYPYTLPAAGSPPAATKLVDAALGTGAGHQTVTVTFTLSIPANSYSGSYASTFTFALVSGP